MLVVWYDGTVWWMCYMAKCCLLVVWYVSVYKVRKNRICRTNIICNDLMYRSLERVRKNKACGQTDTQTDTFAITKTKPQFYELRILPCASSCCLLRLVFLSFCFVACVFAVSFCFAACASCCACCLTCWVSSFFTLFSSFRQEIDHPRSTKNSLRFFPTILHTR